MDVVNTMKKQWPK